MLSCAYRMNWKGEYRNWRIEQISTRRFSLPRETYLSIFLLFYGMLDNMVFSLFCGKV
jgi:hypothetical protein